MYNEFESAENNELMNVFNNNEKETIVKAINGLSTLDFGNISSETKEKIIEYSSCRKTFCQLPLRHYGSRNQIQGA